MKKRLLFFAVTLFFTLAGFNNATATHVIGGEITYKHVAGDTLLVTVKIYRDCNGIALNNSPLQIVSEKHTTASFSLSLISVKDITGIDTAKCGTHSRCSGSYAYGFEEHLFQGKVVLPNDSSCRYVLSWEQCCRNGAITTGASGQNYYMETDLDKCLAPGNSSPEFVRYPIILLNLGQQMSLNHSAIDPDGDFITYELDNPLSAYGAEIPYTGSWSKDKPLTFLGFPNTGLSSPAGFRFDTLTSNMSFRPTKANEVTVVSIHAKEWRKIGGVYTLIGDVIRDVQLYVIGTPNNKIPQIGLPAASGSSQLMLCAPGVVCTTIPVTDLDANDTISYSYTHNLASISVSDTTIHDTLFIRVCGTVDSSMIASGANYFFTLYVQDDVCPLPGKIERSFFVRTSPLVLIPKLGPLFFCESASPISLATAPGPGTTTWSGPGVSGSGPYNFNPASAQAGWHTISYNYVDTVSSCNYGDSVSIRVVHPPKAGFTVNDSVGLPTDSFYFTNTSTADTLSTNMWNLGDTSGKSIYTSNPVHVYGDTGMFTIKLVVSDGICPKDSLIKPYYIKIGSNYLSAPAVFKNGLKLYPTPTANVVYVETETNIRKIEFADVAGRTYNFDTPNGSNKAELNLGWLADGLYIMTVTGENGAMYTGKVLVQR